MKTIPAIEGGKVTRNNFLPFARPLIGQEDIEEVVDTLNSDWLYCSFTYFISCLRNRKR